MNFNSCKLELSSCLSEGDLETTTWPIRGNGADNEVSLKPNKQGVVRLNDTR